MVCGLTLVAIVIINFLGTFMGLTFLDASIFSGILSAGIIHFFTSSGGFTSNQLRLIVQAQTGYKMNEERVTINPSYAFYTAIVYTIVSLVVTFVYYKEYFI